MLDISIEEEFSAVDSVVNKLDSTINEILFSIKAIQAKEEEYQSLVSEYGVTIEADDLTTVFGTVSVEDSPIAVALRGLWKLIKAIVNGLIGILKGLWKVIANISDVLSGIIDKIIGFLRGKKSNNAAVAKNFDKTVKGMRSDSSLPEDFKSELDAVSKLISAGTGTLEYSGDKGKGVTVLKNYPHGLALPTRKITMPYLYASRDGYPDEKQLLSLSTNFKQSNLVLEGYLKDLATLRSDVMKTVQKPFANLSKEVSLVVAMGPSADKQDEIKKYATSVSKRYGNISKNGKKLIAKFAAKQSKVFKNNSLHFPASVDLEGLVIVDEAVLIKTYVPAGITLNAGIIKQAREVESGIVSTKAMHTKMLDSITKDIKSQGKLFDSFTQNRMSAKRDAESEELKKYLQEVVWVMEDISSLFATGVLNAKAHKEIVKLIASNSKSYGSIVGGLFSANTKLRGIATTYLEDRVKSVKL